MTFDFKRNFDKHLAPLEPFKNILYFLFLFFLFEFFWKLFVKEGNDGLALLVLGNDLTPYVMPLCRWTAEACYRVIHDLLGYENFNIHDLYIYFDSSLALRIVWSCTGLKQILQFTFVILCFRGAIKSKSLFIPLSIIVLVVVNLLRLILTSFIVKDGFPHWFIAFNQSFNGKIWDESSSTYVMFYRDWFHLFHDHVFKWVYYDGVIFVLWLVWINKFGNEKQKK